jgi:hypothetical protein
VPVKLIERYVEANRRFAAWNLHAYVPWARRHEPYSFAVGPLILGAGFVVFWRLLGVTLLEAVLYFLVPFVVLFLASAATGIWVRKRRHRTD